MKKLNLKKLKNLKRKKLVMIFVASLFVLTGSYFVAANYGFFGGGTNAPSVPEDTMTRGLVGSWSFDEGTGQTAYDASDSSNNGQLGSTASSDDNDPSWTGEGKNGGGMSFDGVDDYVDCGNDSSLQFQNYITIESWVKTSSATDQTIVDKYGSWDGGPLIYIKSDGNLQFYAYDGSSAIAESSSTFNVIDGEWHHILITVDNTSGNSIFYVDGESESETFTTIGNWGTTGDIYIGHRNKGGSEAYFNGSIDSVRIYNRALSADEVKYHYNRGGPVGYWNFDEGSGTTVFDSTSNNNDGTLKSSGLDFDGVDDYVDCGNDASLNITDAITIEAWVKPESVVGDFMYLVSKSDTYLLRSKTDGNDRFAFYFHDGTSWQGSAYYTYSTFGIFYHVVATYDKDGGANNMRMYINGDLKYQGTKTGAIATNSANLLISTSTYTHNGSIDEVRIYNTALDATEIARHYNNDFSQDPTANLVLLQHFEEGMTCNANDEAGCLTDDSSGGVNDGTLKSFDNLTTWDNGTDGWISEVKKPEWRWVNGKYKTAGEFNGWDDYVDCGNDSSLDITEAITVSAWVKRGLTLGTYQRIIDKRYSAYSLALWTDNKINLNIEGFDGDNNKFSILAITDNNWHHIVGTFGNSVWAIYIDGVLDNSGIDNGSINTNADNILIGAHTNGSQFFNGSIDDVRIYDYARSADEIRLDYNAGVATHLGPSGKTCSEDPAGCVDYGLVGSWGMDEGAGTTAYDSSDNSNDGTLTNGPTWTTDSSPLAGDGGSLKFDGVDDYVDIMDADSLDVTNAITIEAWAKPIGINSVGGSPEYGLSYITSFSGTDLKYESNNFSFRVGNILSSQITVWSSAKSLNEFYHIVGTYDGSLIKIYVNGLEEDSDNQTGDIKLGSLDLHIGNFAGYSNVRHFNGSIDSVRIYNRALLAEEVRYHYNKGGPVAEWKFDEGSGQTAFDGSWNNNDGTRTAGSTSGTVDSGSTATLVDSALTQADDYWNDWTVKIVTTTDSLAPQGETATITDFVATTDTLSFVALTTAVGAGDTYKLYYGDENGPTWTTGKYSSAMSFDGVDDYVDAGSDASLDITDAITVSAWVKTTDTGVWFKAIVAKYGYTSIAESWGLGYTDTNILGFYIRDSGYTQNIAAASTNEGLDGNWHHLIGTANSTVVNFYIDGVLKQSTARTAGDITNDRPVSIARHHVDSYFNGSIDDVRIYDYARTVDEIRLDYQAGVATHLGPSGKDCDEDPAGCMDYGLVGSWGMDEGTGTTAYDSSDNSNDGTLTNGPTWTTDSSPLAGGGGSLKFDGVNDYVDAGDDASLNITDEVTVEAWVYSNGTQADDYAAISGKSTSYYLNFNHTGDSLYFTITDNSINKNTIYAITHNKWVHIVGTFDSTVIKLYMDSIEVDSTDYTGDIDSNINNKIFIGAYGTTGVASNNFFNGSIDSVRIYNRALSAEEVRYHYNKGGPVAEWGFDEGSETTAFDGSWNNNDGTLTNFGTTDTGTAESGGDNTLTDSDKTWSTDQWADGTITTTGGTGLGQSRTVLSNTATIITVSSNWTTNPDATTTYSLVQAPTWTSGKYGSAIKFDGSNDYVDVGNDSSLSFSNNFTLEAWIYPKNYDGGRAIIRKDSSYVIYYSSELDFYNWADSSRLSCQKSNTPLNTWSHVVAVWDGTNKIIYVNGVVCVSAPSVNFSENSNDTHIGSNSFGSDYFFNGSIDDVRIYNYARTAEQIQMDYNAGVATHLK